MQKTRKGFTLVELVVVIAVIAILAGVLIGTFASVINKANASAKAQEIKQQEIEQKATDILKKLEESNWLGWEDFEANLVAKLTEVYKANPSKTITSDEVKAAVNDAFTTYMAAHQTETTGLTEDQVKAIIENALGTLDFSGVTEAQVKAIVTAANANNLTASQVKAIVTAANANNLTANDVAKIVATAGDTSVEAIQTAIENASSTLATSEDVQQILDYLSTTDSTNVILAKALNINISQKGITSASYPYAVVRALGGDSAVNSLPKTVLLDLVDGAPVFFVVDSANKVVYDGGKATLTGTTLTDTDTYQYWTFANTVSNVYSTYLLDSYTSPAAITDLKTGLDVGFNTEITDITYVGNAPSDQTVVIRTNGEGTSLTVNAALDTVHHYDYLYELTVTAVDPNNSYHEHGTVRAKAAISSGHFVVEEGAVVPKVSIENATNTVKVTANEKTLISIDESSGSQTTVVANSDNVFVSGLSQESVSGDVVIAESVNDEASLINALENGYAQLSGDVTVEGNLTISKTVVIDLNGFTFTVNGLIINNGDLTIDDSKDNGQKKVLEVVNDAVSAKTSTDVSTESSLSYTKELQGTLKVESIITSANNSLTILNGSFVSELDYHKYYGTDNVTKGLISVAENGKAVIYNGAFFSENLEDATEDYGAAAVAVISNYGNTVIYKGEFVTKYCRESKTVKPRIQYSYYTISSFGGSLTISPKTNDDVIVYAARGALSLNSGKAEISGGKYNAYHFYAAYIAGSVGNVKGTITGGEFNLIDGGHLSANYALYIGNDNVGDGGKRLPANVTILDCVVNSAKNAINVENSTGTIVVYGGKYNKSINTNFIDTNDYEIIQENGYYVVKQK